MTTVIHLFRFASDIHQFEAGAVIFHEGEPGDLFYCVVEGEGRFGKGESCRHYAALVSCWASSP